MTISLRFIDLKSFKYEMDVENGVSVDHIIDIFKEQDIYPMKSTSIFSDGKELQPSDVITIDPNDDKPKTIILYNHLLFGGLFCFTSDEKIGEIKSVSKEFYHSLSEYSLNTESPSVFQNYGNQNESVESSHQFLRLWLNESPLTSNINDNSFPSFLQSSEFMCRRSYRSADGLHDFDFNIYSNDSHSDSNFPSDMRDTASIAYQSFMQESPTNIWSENSESVAEFLSFYHDIQF